MAQFNLEQILPVQINLGQIAFKYTLWAILICEHNSTSRSSFTLTHINDNELLAQFILCEMG